MPDLPKHPRPAIAADDVPVADILYCLERMAVTSGRDADMKKGVKLWISRVVDGDLT